MCEGVLLMVAAGTGVLRNCRKGVPAIQQEAYARGGAKPRSAPQELQYYGEYYRPAEDGNGKGKG